MSTSGVVLCPHQTNLLHILVLFGTRLKERSLLTYLLMSTSDVVLCPHQTNLLHILVLFGTRLKERNADLVRKSPSISWLNDLGVHVVFVADYIATQQHQEMSCMHIQTVWK